MVRHTRFREKRLHSLRQRLLARSLGAIFAFLLISLAALALLISNVMGRYITQEAGFAMRAVSENLADKMLLPEEMILTIRKNDKLTETLLTGFPKGWMEREELLALLSSSLPLYSDKNKVEAGLPFVEEIYLYDRSGDCLRISWKESLSTLQSLLESGNKLLYQQFAKGETDIQTYPGQDSLTIFSRVEDPWAETLGTISFRISRNAVEAVMRKSEDYPGAFWLLFDKNKNIIQEKAVSKPDQAMRQTFIGGQQTVPEGFSYFSGKKYLLTHQTLSMGLSCVIALPTSQIFRLGFSALLPYLILLPLLLAGVGIFLFTSIARLTRPLPDVTEKLGQVQAGDFSVKLPAYDSREFAAVSAAFNSMTDTINHLINDVYEKKLLAMDSEIRLLQSQINPHFMYNVLSSIAFTARMDGNEQIYNMASAFASLTQARLSAQGEIKVSLSRELEYIRFYLDLQKARFGEKIQYRLTLSDESLKDCLIPKLSIEMLVENAVSHGLEPKPDGGTVSIKINETEGNLCICVSDDGVGFADQSGVVPLPLEEREPSRGMHNRVAINNVFKLLKHLYGEPYGLQIESYTGDGTSARILIPMEIARDDSGDDR